MELFPIIGNTTKGTWVLDLQKKGAWETTS